MEPIPLLVASLGNPPPYANTLHSAGHLLLPMLLEAFAPSNPPLSTYPGFRGGRASSGLAHAFFVPSASMNVLGPSVVNAWRAFLASVPSSQRRRAKLVLVHDELELALGRVKLRQGTASARGHNGVKSVARAMGGNMGSVVRIAVGIGRPESRERGVVSDYVLRKMTSKERAVLEGAVVEVVDVLRELEVGEDRPTKGKQS